MGIKDSQQLKQLQTRRDKLQVELNALDAERREAQQKHQKVLTQLNNVNQEIEAFSYSDVVITEHAILRFFERAMGFDIEDVKNRILSDKVKAQIRAFGNGKYPIGEGLTIVVKNNTIVSIMD